MRLRRMGAAPAAVAGTLLVVIIVRAGGWPLYLGLVLAVSLLGGYVIGRWWAVGIAFATSAASSALPLAAVAYLFRHPPRESVAAILFAQSLLSGAATALAVWLRRGVSDSRRSRR